MSRHVSLLRHPDFLPTPLRSIEVEVARRASRLALTFVAAGEIARLRLPEEGPAERTDGLWQHTCFEAFVRSADSLVYWEFNFSPSRRWAAYRFDAYREGMAAEMAVADPGIQRHATNSIFQLSVALDISAVDALASLKTWCIGLSAIIEDENGSKSWWALAHAAGKPDFHRPENLQLCLLP